MERLTERYKDGITNMVLIKECGSECCDDICNSVNDCDKCQLNKAFEKLADYEDLEERLNKIFGARKITLSLADVVNAIEKDISDPNRTQILEKNIPKKPNNLKTILDFSGRYHTEKGDCPACGEEGIYRTQSYCHRCGQSLDWEK